MYFIFSDKLLSFIGGKINPYFLVVAIVTIWNFFRGMEELKAFDDWESSYILLKLNSLMFRLSTSYDGFLYMQEHKLVFLYGMGNGRSLEITNRVFHNLYFQQFFDHGLFYYVLFSFIIFFFLKYKFNIKIVKIIVLLLLLNNILFDNLYSFAILIFAMSYNQFSRKNICV